MRVDDVLFSRGERGASSSMISSSDSFTSCKALNLVFYLYVNNCF